MSCSDEASFFVGDFGDTQIFIVHQDAGADVCCDNPVFDISAADGTLDPTNLTILISRPAHESLVADTLVRTYPAVSFVTDGTDGQMQIVIEEGLRDRPGQYRMQATAKSATFQRSATVRCFTVRKVLGT